MKKSILIALIAILPSFLFAQKGSYLLKLSDVTLNGVSVGKITTDSVKPSQIVIYVSNYKDSLINATFKWNLASIDFELINESKPVIKIIWNDASYVDYNNTAGKVMHLGVKYIDRNSDQPSTTIISGSKISDSVTPTDNVFYTASSYGGWDKKSLLPSVGKKEEKLLVGKKVKLLLPIVSSSKQLDYIFTFDIVFHEYKK